MIAFHHAANPPKCGGLMIGACGHWATAAADMNDWMAAPPRAATTNPTGTLGFKFAMATPVPQHSAEKNAFAGGTFENGIKPVSILNVDVYVSINDV